MNNLGKLYIVATPIGNLEDITLRALRVLKEADLILCEDTRVTKKLLDRYEIQKPLLSYHHHSKLSRVEKIVEHLENGKNLALVSDAGTPGIQDPGNQLIAKLFEIKSPSSLPRRQAGSPFAKGGEADSLSLIKGELERDLIEIIPIPGVSALTAIASVAGINMDKFLFFGFPPHKKGRETFFREVAEAKYPVVYFESPHRFFKNLELLENFKPGAKLIVGREITKMFEEIVRGGIQEIKKIWAKKGEKQKKGEFVLIIY
jgi:16S rRNA (cytidine1402-2'-O)-methyltransferase